MAATDRLRGLLARGLARLVAASRGRAAGVFGAMFGGLFGGLFATGSARAVDLPEDRVEQMFHLYQGGGTRALGPALLVRKSVADRVSLTGTYYIDIVSNASIDVVTQASRYKETRTEYNVGADYLVRDTLIHLSTDHSSEPDYLATSTSLDLTQDAFGGMTTVTFGFTKGSDSVRKKGSPTFLDHAGHWQYRLGLTQILTPRWVLSLNGEAIADDGFLGSPYRSALVFGAAVPERDPRTRSSRSLKIGVRGDVGEPGARAAVHADYRFFKDTWDISANTFTVGYSRYFGDELMVDAFVRFYGQRHALFYTDNATAETLYVSRNRQLSTFHDIALGSRLSYSWKASPDAIGLSFNASFDLMQFKYRDFTDIRTGSPYQFSARVLQLYAIATF